MKKKITKADREIMNKWIMEHGACTFDIENQDIILHDGGLFSIEKEKIMLPKVTERKKLPDGKVQILFSKKKYPSERTFARLWMIELDETINYFVNMKKMLNNLGIRTKVTKRK